jgi:hypothetical protein
MAPPEVMPLPLTILSVEITVVLVSFLKIYPVSTIFVAVPHVVVTAVSIVVASLVMVSLFSSRHGRTDQAAAQHQRAQH